MIGEGDVKASAALDCYVDRLVRFLAVVCDLIDLDIIVLGGGMSNVDVFYECLSVVIVLHVFFDIFEILVCKVVHGDSLGVCGVVWLWLLEV